MTDLSNHSQFDTLALEKGKLPDAPLAMPAQTLEPSRESPLAALLQLLRPARAKAGH
jgi:hypothetical protein